MNEKKEALRMEILKYIEKHSRVELGELAVLVGVEETDVANSGIVVNASNMAFNAFPSKLQE